MSHNAEVVVPHQTEGTFEIDAYDAPCYLYECVAPLRALLMQKSAPTKFKKLLGLESHLEKRRGTSTWDACQEKVVGVAKKTLGVMVFEALFPQLDLSDEMLQRVQGVFDTNAIEIRLTQSEVMALYETACLLEHSCTPNMRMTFDEKFNVSMFANIVFYLSYALLFCLLDHPPSQPPAEGRRPPEHHVHPLLVGHLGQERPPRVGKELLVHLREMQVRTFS